MISDEPVHPNETNSELLLPVIVHISHVSPTGEVIIEFSEELNEHQARDLRDDYWKSTLDLKYEPSELTVMNADDEVPVMISNWEMQEVKSNTASIKVEFTSPLSVTVFCIDKDKLNVQIKHSLSVDLQT